MKKIFGLFLILLLVSLLFSCVKTKTDPQGSVLQTTNDPAETTNQTITDHIETSGHTHSFSEATCTTPKTCSVCSVTEGNALGHSWSDATCTTPKTCSVCSVTEGNALGHSWSDATCAAPKTCDLCSITEGDTLPHKISYKTGRCVDCGAFEYNVNYAVYGSIQLTQEWLVQVVDSYLFINTYYVYKDTCVCSQCSSGIDVGTPYLTSVMYIEYTQNGETYRFVEVSDIHKKYSPETDTNYMLVAEQRPFTYYYQDDKIVRIVADDMSFIYEQEDLIPFSLDDLSDE